MMVGESFRIYFSEMARIAFYEYELEIIIRTLWSKFIPTLTLTLIYRRRVLTINSSKVRSSLPLNPNPNPNC